MSEKYDVIVIGAGILGMATAYHMKLTHPDLEILVVDKNASAGAGNTAQSAAMYRDTFASEVNLILSSTTRNFFYHVQRELGIDLALKDITYLWLMDKEQFEGNQHAIEIMKKNNIKIDILDKTELKKRLPELVTDFKGNEEAEMLGIKNIDYGLLGYHCGELDADRITRNFYEAEFKKLGGKTLYNTRIMKLKLEPTGEKLGIPGEPVGWQGKKIGAAITDKGEELIADTFIVATGAWANELLLPIGVNPYVMPLKKSLFRIQNTKLDKLLDNKHFNDEETIPFIILPVYGIYIKPVKYNHSVWIGGGNVIGHPYELTCPELAGKEGNPLDNPQADPRDYEYDLYLILSQYLPILRDVPLTNYWAGYYAVNTIDKNPVVFKPTGIEGLIVVTAASGSGIMKADAIGRIATGLYDNKEYVELYGGVKFKVSRLGVTQRDVDKEFFVI